MVHNKCLVTLENIYTKHDFLISEISLELKWWTLIVFVALTMQPPLHKGARYGFGPVVRTKLKIMWHDFSSYVTLSSNFFPEWRDIYSVLAT